MVITRYAPSPTGEPHIGNIRTAIFAWLFARSKAGKFYLRIEDTDKEREKPGSIEAILDSLEWLELDFDDPASANSAITYRTNYPKIVFQSDRLEIYREYAHQLVADGYAYVCDCSSERLGKLRESQISAKLPPMYDGHCREFKNQKSNFNNCVIRLKIPRDGQTKFVDLIRGEVSFENQLIDDQVLLKSDGYPTYHLANVVDDHLMGVTHVIRAEEWLPSTPKHLILYQYFNWPSPSFAHLPMILGNDKSKLSKRHGAVAALDYRRQGYLPEVMFNYLSLLGWHPGGDQEIFNRGEVIDQFELNRVQKSPAIFDQNKLDWLNGVYLRNLAPHELWTKLVSYSEQFDADQAAWLKQFTGERAVMLVQLVQERLRKLSEFKELTNYLSNLPDYASEMLIFKKSDANSIKKALQTSVQIFDALPEPEFTAENVTAKLNAVIADESYQIGVLLHPLRVALTGLKNSPGPQETAAVLGKEESLRRINLALAKLA
ncbi:MAG: glutamate--tRNA ligase [Candidatus Jacksonbacteria bacterium RIFOXYB2_FULL_44_15]|nr:MAG: glutamate--tRNA ligase [Candidatus Jacksonbacteria bacterium RIFOXYB2_FULL_44_15]